MKATMTANGDESATINLPHNLSEVPLNRYIDFIVECRNFGIPDKNQITAMARATGAFYGVELDDMIKRTLIEVEDAEIVGLDSSLRGLFGYALEMVRTAKGETLTPDKAEMTYKGDVYRMPTMVQSAISGEPSLPNMSVIEAVEASEIQRLTRQAIDNRGNPNGELRKRVLDLLMSGTGVDNVPDKKVLDGVERIIEEETAKAGDPDGSLMYSMYLRLLAVLMRKDGENMPIGDAEREAWIMTRAAHFADIDAQTAMNVDFFLLCISRQSPESPNAIGFLTRPMMRLLVETQLRTQKPEWKPNRKMRRLSTVSGGGKSLSRSLKRDGSGKSKKSTGRTSKMPSA